MAYIGGMFYVRWHTTGGRIFDRIFRTEQEARAFANAQWKLPFVVDVGIYKMGFTSKKRRNTTEVAFATKADKKI